MAGLVRGGLFVSGFPPDNGEHIGLEIEGEVSEFCVYRVRHEFHCEEIREANPRRLRHSEEGLTMHTLVRARFYELVAKDLGITGQVIDLGHGIWELGRKRLPGRDISKVIFIEAGVPAAILELTLMRERFTTLCLLHHGKSPRFDWHSDKTLLRGLIEVRDGRCASDVFEDLAASQRDSSADTRIELEEHPPKLWICGEEFMLPNDRGRPTLGVYYFAHLCENPRSLISCWDIERMVNPKLKGLASIAFGADPRMDKATQQALDESIRQAKTSLDEAKNDPGAAQFEIDEAQAELDRLLEQKKADTGKAGKSRLLGDTDNEKARRRVRKALDAVVAFVAKQKPAIEQPLREAVGEGAEIYFNPPPDWGL